MFQKGCKISYTIVGLYSLRCAYVLQFYNKSHINNIELILERRFGTRLWSVAVSLIT